VLIVRENAHGLPPRRRVGLYDVIVPRGHGRILPHPGLLSSRRVSCGCRRW
jgi:hypothetical protein